MHMHYANLIMVGVLAFSVVSNVSLFCGSRSKSRKAGQLRNPA